MDVFRQGYRGVYASGAKWGDPRQPFRLSVIQNSTADFLEIHIYPHKVGDLLDAQLTSFEYKPQRMPKPAVLAETGAFKEEIKSPEEVASTLQGMLRQACSVHLAGWAYWTWDTDNQIELWNLKQNSGYLEQRLSPRYFDWCSRSD
jgi:hypothetical protein